MVEGGNVNQHVCIIRVKEKKLNARYLNQFIISDIGQNQIDSFQAGGNRQGLNFGQIRSFSMPFPPFIGEQKKIANCLSSIDNLITAQNQKLEFLTAHKKGLMQQLFPDKGKVTPKLRFSELQSQWSEHLFGKILKINSGKGFKAAEYTKSGIRLLQIENVGYGLVKWNENTIHLPKNYYSEYPDLVLTEGDVVLALNRPVTNGQLKIAKISQDDAPSVLYQRVGKFELLNKEMNFDFIFHICREFIKEFVLKQSIGSDQPFISLRTLYSQKILLPALNEQQKIADSLTSIDTLITAQSRKIKALKTHKKGLMQQLFPTVDEVNR